MYNPERKDRFINYYTKSDSTKLVCGYIFNACEPYEQRWNADLCTQNAEVLTPIVEGIVGMRKRSVLTKVGILKEYVRWCINSGVKNASDGMLKVNIAGIDKMKTLTVWSPAGLQAYLDSIFDEERLETTDSIYRCCYWLAYSGVKEEDILKLKCSDVDLRNLVITFDGKEYVIYREAIHTFRNCVELESFLYRHPKYKEDIRIDRADGGMLLRGIKGEMSIKSMRMALARKSKKCIDEGRTNLKLSYGRIWLSGLFYRTRLDEEAGKPVNFLEVARDAVESEYHSRGMTNVPESNMRAAQLRVSRDYLDDYRRWKLANMR